LRQGSIPHGTSILAQGIVIPTVKGQIAKIEDADPTPFIDKGPVKSPEYLAPFTKVALPTGAKPEYLKNPNQALKDPVANQVILGRLEALHDLLDGDLELAVVAGEVVLGAVLDVDIRLDSRPAGVGSLYWGPAGVGRPVSEVSSGTRHWAGRPTRVRIPLTRSA
jgi:hypothetical protein